MRPRPPGVHQAHTKAQSVGSSRLGQHTPPPTLIASLPQALTLGQHASYPEVAVPLDGWEGQHVATPGGM